ncbi:MAG: hypothetical protein IIB56_19425, partial [Planctomycetes bacterium]|nr:hypothetical protein [Planctomycetota bacterium]
MCRKLIYLVSIVLMVSQACNAVEVARWDFEETSGTTATDGIGQYVATLAGSDTLDVDGKFGSGIDFAGDGGAIVDAAGSDALRFTGDFSIVLWVKSDVAFGAHTRFVDISAADGGLQDSYRLFTHSGGNTDNFKFMSRQNGSNTQNIHTRDMAVGTWILLVVRHDLDGDVTMNVLQDGDSVDAAFVGANNESWPTAGSIVYAAGELKFGRLIGGGRKFDGQMDGVAFYDEVLTDAQVAKIFNTAPASDLIAASPNPADEATDVLREVTLSWTPGEFAAPTNGHKVYLGQSFNDVNDATGGVAQDANSYAPGQLLDFGTTYYWRVDEVNAPPTSQIEFKGEVWQFTTEPIAYAIENITATASSTHQADTGTENTINGSGLDANDLHSIEPTDMWLSGDEPNAWIEYEFDKVHKLHEMWVWNHNGMLESVIGFGFKDVAIEYSVNGTDYTTLGTTHEFVRAPGAVDYAHNTTVDFGGVTAKYVRLTANSNWGGIMPQYGLSEVRFFSIPVFAREPSPDSGTTDVAVDVTLGFRAGREAATHDVYLSSDEQAVIDGNAPVSTVTETSYGPLSLDLGTTYYWKINEVNMAETPTTWQGDIWNFSTQEFLVVDDFEDYNDYPPDEIWSTWVDGYGVPTNGAAVGYPAPDWGAGEHYVETTIVHGGSQAMPFFYDNTVATYSEATANVADLQAGQDWAKHGIKALTLRFYGDPNNAVEQMYVKVNDFKVTYDGDAENLKRIGWQMWYIDLASLGVSLSNVTELSIGFERIGAFGGQGVVYFDGIRLYSYDRQLITPAEAGTTGLQAYYEFEGTYSDSSGNARHGTAMGNPTFVAG